MRTARSITVISVLTAVFMAATVPRMEAAGQPDPASRAQVETAYVNLDQAASFSIAIKQPVVLRVRAIDFQGERILRIIMVRTAIERTSAASRLTYREAQLLGLSKFWWQQPEPALREPLSAGKLSYIRRLT